LTSRSPGYKVNHEGNGMQRKPFRIFLSDLNFLRGVAFGLNLIGKGGGRSLARIPPRYFTH
jgi:hypothetical protein